MMGNASSQSPPLPQLPEPPIFDPPYNARLAAVLDGSAFPPDMPPDQVYHAQLGVLQAIIDELKSTSVNLAIALMVAWLLMVVLCGLLLVRIRRNRQLALSGDVDAARKIVLPAFEPLLWLLCGSNLLYVVVYGVLLAGTDLLNNQNRLTIEVAVVVKQINGLLVPIYLLQPSLSLRALRTASVQTVALSVYTIPVLMVLTAVESHRNTRFCYWTLMAARGLVGLYLLYCIVYPPARASALAFRVTCAYVITMMLLIFATAESFHRGHPDVAKTLAWAVTFYSMALPICVWLLLRADTEHWRGIGKRAVELQDVFRRSKGKIDERVSSQGLHVLIEMHRKFIIDFAHLQLRGRLREGTRDDNSAAVYRGFLHTKKAPVAIKIYMPIEFTEETVAEFSHEAALCGSLVHPNVVKFYGLCVCPPNICLVTELCQRSLQDVVDSHSRAARSGLTMPSRRQQFLISIGHMIDAARAVAYLHSFSPAFVHRDIKPSNFLVDDEGTVKLTDFGASRTLAVRATSSHQYQPSEAISSKRTQSLEEAESVGRSVVEVPGVVANSAKYTAQYMAPEVIKGRHAGTAIYGEAADIYSLAMTMWDLLHPGMSKYQLGGTTKSSGTFGRRNYGHERDSEIFDLVFAGHRPALDPELHPTLKGLLESAWHADPRHRPTAQGIVATLATVQEEACATFALELMSEVSEPIRAGGRRLSTSFAGTHAVERLRICDFVDTQSEAIRLGNMLMDSGFLHHTKHSRAFEYAGSQYVFDQDQISLCQPLAMLDLEDDNSHRASHEVFAGLEDGDHERTRRLAGQRNRSVGSSYRLPHAERGHDKRSCSSHVVMERHCACRRLAQRVENASTTRRRLRRKFKVFADENALTAQLLADDQQFHSANGGDFAAFQEATRGRVGAFRATASEAA